MRIVYFFCTESSRDRVAPAAFDACRSAYELTESHIKIDGQAAFEWRDPAGNLYCFVPTRDVVSHDYIRYVPAMIKHFADFDLAGLVNWHEGAGAPDRIFCAHTFGDVKSGVFGRADASLTTAMFAALETTRVEMGLDEWRVLPEATHFSGVRYGVDPSEITRFPVPTIDVEIGSSRSSWSNPTALRALALSMTRVADFADCTAQSVLFVGGTHFEPCLHRAITETRGCFSISHVLPNQWLVSGQYECEDGIAKLKAALDSIRDGVHGFVYHDGLKGIYKQIVRILAADCAMPAVKHKRLRRGLQAFEV